MTLQRAQSISANKRRASPSNVSPAEVSVVLLLVRMKSRTPRRHSSLVIAFESGDCSIPTRAAARAKCNSSASKSTREFQIAVRSAGPYVSSGSPLQNRRFPVKCQSPDNRSEPSPTSLRQFPFKSSPGGLLSPPTPQPLRGSHEPGLFARSTGACRACSSLTRSNTAFPRFRNPHLY